MSEQEIVLQPCPFCGGPAKLFQKYQDPQPSNWRVCCDAECSMEPYADLESEADAIAAWNRRPPAAPDRDALVEDGAKIIFGNDLAWIHMLEKNKEQYRIRARAILALKGGAA